MRHRFTYLTILFAASAACGGDGNGDAPASQDAAGRVGVVLASPAQPQHAELERSVRQALEEQDQELVVQSANDDPARQQQLVQTFASRGARAIVVVPIDSASLRPAIDAAANARVPVFTIGLPVTGARVTTHMESDFTAAGVAAAEYIKAFLGRGLHAAVVGRVGAHGTRELDAAFRAAVTADTVGVMSGTGDGGGTREGAAAAVTALLERDPSLDAVFAMDPVSALGAMDAAYARRRADLVIISFGSSPEVLASIGDTGPMRAAVVPRLDEAGRLLAEAIVTQLGGDPVTAAIKVPVRLVTADSAKE